MSSGGRAARWLIRPIVAGLLTWLVIELPQEMLWFGDVVRWVGGSQPNWVFLVIDVFTIGAAGAVAAAARIPRSGDIPVVDVVGGCSVGIGAATSWIAYYDGLVVWVPATAVAVTVTTVLVAAYPLLGGASYRRELLAAVGVLAALLVTVSVAGDIHDWYDRWVPSEPMLVEE